MGQHLKRRVARVVGLTIATAMLGFAPGAAWAASEELDCPLTGGTTALHFWVDEDLGSVKWALTSGSAQSFQTHGDGTNVDITADHISLHAASQDVNIDRATGHLHSANGRVTYEGECTPGNAPPPDDSPQP
jgi:hypothetical protein